MPISSLSWNTQFTSRIQAQVHSLTTISTTLGDRTYAVFNTIDGAMVGFWADTNHRYLRTLRIGDAVTLKRDANGHLSLASQSMNFFVRLQRFWKVL